jgi:laminin alpha 3/5
VWALERSNDQGQTWKPWQFFAGSDAECQKYFGIHADEKITRDDQVVCETDFSSMWPMEDGEVYMSLLTGRPSAKDPFSSQTLRDWILATNVRLRLIQTKTMLGHLMSVAQGDKTVTRRVSVGRG